MTSTSCAGKAGLHRLALQRGALGAVADDQRPDRPAAGAQDRGGPEQRAYALVRDQAGHHAGYVLVRLDAEIFAEGGRVGQRLEELPGYGVRHDEDLLPGAATGRDLLPHRL